MKKLLGLSTLICCLQVSAANWNVNDVSILFDLPKSNEELNFMIGASSANKRGALLPTAIHNLAKPLVIGDVDMPKDEYGALRVVAARLDPCFKYVPSPNKCFPQLRLVWQPVSRTAKSDYTTMDAGLHSFYELSPTEWQDLLTKMGALKIKMEKAGITTNGAPLNIHPALKNPMTRQVFMTEMRAIVAEFAGKQNLSRVTFMRLFTSKIWWVFGGFEIKNGVATKMKLVRHDPKEDVQNFFNDDFNEPMGMKGSIVPELINPTKSDDLTELLKNYSYTFSTPEGIAYAKKSLETLDRVDNPNHFTPETIDCVHCHMANATRAWLDNKDKKFYQANQKTTYKYTGLNLTNTSANLKNPKSLRIFGYLGKTTAIGQRVINESAEVAKILNRASLLVPNL